MIWQSPESFCLQIRAQNGILQIWSPVGNWDRGWSHTGPPTRHPPQHRTRTQDTSLLTPCFLFHRVAYAYILWDVTGYFKINSQSGLYNFYLFLIDGKSYPVHDNSRSWVWVHQNLASFTVSQDMSCHTIAFQTLVSSWHSLESCKKRGDIYLFCFVSNKEIQSSGRTDSMVSV